MKKLTPDQWMGVVLGIMATLVLALAILDMQAGWSSFSPMKTGEPMPPVEGRDLDGEIVKISAGDTNGRVLLLDFWATWCGPCIEEMPILQRLHQRYEREGLDLLAVNTDSGTLAQRTGLVRDFLRTHDLDVPVMLDDGRVETAYRVQVLPTLYLVGRDGKIREVYVGVTSEATLEGKIRAALDAPVPPPKRPDASLE